ncbi:MAG TPA: ABC transporter substrate-binding protein [Coriobacteriia bacterium]
MTGRHLRLSGTLAALGLAALLALSGCAGGPMRTRPVTPKLRPPAIARQGVLRIAVDEHYPPFASLDGGQVIGLDADVGAALAAQLGLKAEFVDVPVTGIGAALREKRVDVALGGVPITQAALSEVTVATSYLADAPVLFSPGASVTVQDLDRLRVAVQKGSPAFWLLRAKVGEERLMVFPALRDAFNAVKSGKADAVAGDAIVAGYIRREFPSLLYAGQLADAGPLALMVAKDAAAVEPSAREAMDELAATGVLDAIRGKWLGDLPALSVPSSADMPSGDASRSLDTTLP